MEHQKESNDVPCLFPYHVKNPAFPVTSRERYLPVPCGKCPPCVERRSNQWQFRLIQQEKISSTAAFITLTYDTKFVPISPKGYMTLKKKDFQDFMKRLRKAHPKGHEPLKYYAVGEYGSKRFRPHYHAIIFNMDPKLLQGAWTDPDTKEIIGDAQCDPMTPASVAYTCKYLSKGKLIPEHKNDDRLPEFSLMSKGLGANYMTPQIIGYHQADLSRNYVTTPEGHKIGMPRYYRTKIYDDEQRETQGRQIASNSREADEQRRRDHAKRTGTPDTYERDQFESKRAELRNARERARQKRNKL